LSLPLPAGIACELFMELWGKHRLCAPWCERISVEFYSFLFGLALLAFGGCSPQNLAAAKGKRGRLLFAACLSLDKALFSAPAVTLRLFSRKIAFSPSPRIGP